MKYFYLFFLCISISINIVSAQSGMGPWSNTGPVDFPINVSGQIHGIGRVSQIKFHPSSSQKMYAVSASGGLYISNNNGQTWAPTPGTEQLPATSCSAVCIDYTNDQVMYLCLGDANYYGNNYGIYKSTDGGNTWLPANSNIGTSMAVEILMNPSDHNTLVAATKNGIWKTTNAGTSWTLKQTGSFRDMKAKPLNNTTLYAVTGLQFYISTDFGDTWTQITNGVTPPANNEGMRIAVSNADTARVYLLTTNSNGVVMKSVNSGLSFTTVYNSSSQCLVCYDASPSSTSQGDYNIDLTANPQNANELILVSHCVWRSIDGGVTWSKRTNWYADVHTDMHHIEFNPYNNSQLFNANDGGVWLSTDTSATAWSPRSDGLAATEIYHAAQSPVTRQMVSIGTQDNGELYFSNNWKCNRGGDWGSKCRFDYATPATVYYLENGKRRNLAPLGGEQDFNCPFIPTNNASMEFVPSMPGVAFIGKDSLWSSNTINTTTVSWSLIRASTETIRDISSCRADSNILYYVTSSNHLFRSDNALSASPTFTQLSTPASTGVAASIATNKNNANIVFITCGSAVYRSADKGVTWTNITGTGLSGANIRKIIHDDYSTNERLFVNAGSYVHYKNNTTTSWTNYSNNQGLPTIANATDFMIYNNGTAASILRLSTYGRGVWEADINDNLAPLPDFTADKQLICPGDTVHFYKTIYGNVSSFTWNFPGGSPASSQLDTPAVVFNTIGTYNISLTATGTGGSNTTTKTAYITVSNGQGVAIQEGFEGTSFPPTDWSLISESGNSWEQTNTASGFGSSTKCTRFDNYNNDAGGKHDKIITPKTDVTNVDAAYVTFDVAYAPYSAQYPDSLMVQVSTDCGNHYTPVYVKTGSGLATAPAFISGEFVPLSTQWRKDTISLTAYVGNSIQLSFENIGHYGQPVYIDNVNITMSPVSKFATVDTSICVNGVVHFSDSSANASSWSWSFQGGTPATATIQNPVVTYSTPGIYNVTLIATNNLGSDTFTKNAYIKVNPQPMVVVVASGTTLAATGATGNYQWYLNGVAITGATNSTYIASQNGNYTVAITDVHGCSGTSPTYIYTSVNDAIAGLYDISIYPNPTSGHAIIKGKGFTDKEMVLVYYNTAGQKVKQQTLKTNNGTLEQNIDISSLPKGVYKLCILTNEGQEIVKSIILL